MVKFFVLTQEEFKDAVEILLNYNAVGFKVANNDFLSDSDSKGGYTVDAWLDSNNEALCLQKLYQVANWVEEATPEVVLEV